MNKTGIKNLAPKIISILFALVLWIYVMGAINPRVTRTLSNVSVNLINVEEVKNQGFILTGNKDFSARVKLTGRRDEVYNVSADQIELNADLRGYTLGSNNIPLEVSVPGNIDVDLSPRYINVNLEEIIKKQRDVKVIISGIPEESYSVGELQYKPTVVWIEGPESYVNSVEHVIAQLDISGESDELILSLPLKPVNSRGEEVPNIDVETSYADVSLSIDLLKTVPIKPNYNINAAEDYEITELDINPKEIKLKGPKEIISAINEISTELIEAEDIRENKVFEAKLNLPEKVTIENETDIILNVSVAPFEEKSIQISKDNIKFNNLSPKLEIDKSNLPDNLDITVTAIKDVLDKINKGDLKVIVDLNGLNSGEYEIEPLVETSFSTKDNIESIKIDPETISIELKEE